MLIKLDEWKIFKGSTMCLALANIFMSRIFLCHEHVIYLR